MKAEEVIKHLVDVSGKSMYRVSLDLGKSKLYIARIVHDASIPNVKTLLAVCDATGHDLIVRNRETGDEFIIDPPEKD